VDKVRCEHDSKISWNESLSSLSADRSFWLLVKRSDSKIVPRRRTKLGSNTRIVSIAWLRINIVSEEHLN